MKKYGLTALVAVAVVALMLFLVGQRPVGAQETTEGSKGIVRTVSVNGTGTITATPDQATIQIGVRTQGETAEEALAANNTRMTSLLNSLKAASLAQRDIQTRDFSIWPQYRTSTNGTNSITGYEVHNLVVITVRDLDNFGSVLDAAVKAGSNEINSIQFGFSNPNALLDQARVAAMADAERKAGELAKLADVEVGTVVTISEMGALQPPMPMERMAMDTAAGSVPIESGESAVTLSVQVTYELVP